MRRRGLEALVRFLRNRRSTPDQAGPALEMLARALNDSSATVRSEAFKATLNLQASGGGVHTLRFILQSVHADVRLEVLTEVMAQVREPWAWNLLLEFYNDPEPMLRQEAFNTAVAQEQGAAAAGSRPAVAVCRRAQAGGRWPHQEAHGTGAGAARQGTGRHR